MKKVLIPVLVALALMIGAIIFFVGLRFSQVQYEKDTQAHFMAIADDGGMTAVYEDQTVLVAPGNWGRASWLLTITERKRLLLKPDVSSDDAVVFSLGDGAEYTVIPDTSVDDAVYICYAFEGREKWFRVEGYDVMNWAQRVASPEGVYVPNEVIEPEQ